MRKLVFGLFFISGVFAANGANIGSIVVYGNEHGDQITRKISQDGTITAINLTGGANPSTDMPEYTPDEVIFKLATPKGQRGVQALEALQVMQQRLQKVVQRYRFVKTKSVFANRRKEQLKHIHRACLPAGLSPIEACKQLQADPEIEWAEPHHFRYTQETEPNDPSYSSQWHLLTIGAPAAWNVTTGDPNVVIAIIDTGVDWDHPDLAANIWTNTGEIPNDGNDNDENGFIDDVRGWDFVSVDSAEVYSGEDPGPPDNDPMDFDGHGTHVAGIAGAVGNNGIGVAGVCWNAKLMAVRAGYKDYAGRGILQVADIADALVYAADNGAHVINMSFGSTSPSNTERIAINYAASHGCILVAAAGNDETTWPCYPASFNSVLSVAATSDASDTKARFSNYSLWVDVAAPGSSIYSTYFDNTYKYLSGTSMASPVVAGLAAMVKSAHVEWDSQDILNQIIATADDIDAANPFFAGKLGGGRVNAEAAVGAEFAGIKLNLVSSLPQDIEGDDDDELEPNEIISLYTTIKNFAEPQNVAALLSSADPWVTIVNGTVLYGTIERHRCKTNSATPYTFYIEPNIPSDHVVPFNLEILANGTPLLDEIIEIRLAPTWSRPHTIWADESDIQIIRAMDDGRLLAVMDLDTYPTVHDGIYATVREPNGIWSPLERLSGTSGWSCGPHMAFGPDGDAHVVYERNNPYPDKELFYTRYDAATDTWSAEYQLTTKYEYCPISGTNVTVSADSNGFIHVVWLDCRSGNNQIYYIYHDGVTWQPEMVIYDANNASISLMTMFDTSDGTRHLFWKTSESGDSDYYVIKGIGATWEDPNLITGFVWSNPPFQVGDHTYMLYRDNCSDDLKLAEFGGNDWTKTEKLVDNPFGSSCTWYASLAMPDDGTTRLAYSWFDSGGSWKSWVDWTRREDGVWSEPLTVSTFDMFIDNPKMIVDHNYFDHIIAKNWTPSGGGWYGDAKPTYLTNSPIDVALVPPRPIVTDDGITTKDPSKLHASWSTSHSSGIANYMYAIGTAPGEADIVDWVKFTSTTDYTRSMTNTPLQVGQAYYVTIRAHSNAVYSSPIGFSDGIIYQPADFGGNGSVNFADFTVLASYWLTTNCSAQDNCEGTDLEPDGDVDLEDLASFVEHWIWQAEL